MGDGERKRKGGHAESGIKQKLEGLEKRGGKGKRKKGRSRGPSPSVPLLHTYSVSHKHS